MRVNDVSLKNADVVPRGVGAAIVFSSYYEFQVSKERFYYSGAAHGRRSPSVDLESRRTRSPRGAAHVKSLRGARRLRGPPYSFDVHDSEAPKSSTSRGAAKFGDGATHDPHRFWRFLRVQSSTDRGPGGRPPFGRGGASQHAVGSV